MYDAGPYHDDSWYEDLQDASGLDTSPDTGLVSPLGSATKKSASFTMVMRRAADLQFPAWEIKTNVLTEGFQPGQTNSESLFPFNKALTSTLLWTWANPCSGILSADRLPDGIAQPRVT